MIRKERFMLCGSSAVLLLALSSLTGCSTSDESGAAAGKVLMVSASAGGSGSRTAVDITDPQNPYPDYSKGEGFLWTAGDKVAAWAESTDGTTNGSALDITAQNINTSTADFPVPADGLPAAGKCYLYYPSAAVGSGTSAVTMPMPEEMTTADYGSYDKMYADVITYDATSQLQNAYSTIFHHLGALLRFNILNTTDQPYTIQSCEVNFSSTTADKNVIPATLVYDVKAGTSALSGYRSRQLVTNSGYATDTKLIDDAATADRDEAVGDLLMPILPTKGLAEGFLTITLKVYNRETGTTVTMLPLAIDCTRYDFLTSGFSAGKRYYFALDITGGKLNLHQVTVSPWGLSGEVSGKASQLIANQKLVAILKNQSVTVAEDGFIHVEDAAVKAQLDKITNLDVSGQGLTSLGEIQYLKNLQYLYCSSNQLSSLDVSKNTSLKYLDCNSNKLSSLDVSKNTSLTILNCSYNKLSSLDVSKNTSLTSLYCNSNKLSSLDVSKNTSLTTLYCNSNKLSSLDVSKNTSLKYLYCFSNQLSSLDVSKNTSLMNLRCHVNQLSSLDVSKNTSLTQLDCQSNKLSSLDVSKNTSLTYLSCGSQTDGNGNNQTLTVSLTEAQNTALHPGTQINVTTKTVSGAKRNHINK